jgi:hypothetical protein
VGSALPWLNITVLSLGDEPGCAKWLTESPGARYPQKQGNTGLFSNMTPVLLALGRVGFHKATFSGPAEPSLDPSRLPNRSKWQNRRIIPGGTVSQLWPSQRSSTENLHRLLRRDRWMGGGHD